MTTSNPSSSTGVIAQKTFEIANKVQTLDEDQIFKYNAEEQKTILNEKKWKSDPHHFKKVRVSGVALIKMVMHARSGGQYEIMGLMQGKIDGDTFVVMDSFALPVEGTETRVNAANEANEYLVEFLEHSKHVGRLENVVGWYHSHPGYGCWLSGIDVNTQLTNQTYTDPFVAIVIDPNRTISAGRVEIGAFRTYPKDYVPPDGGQGDDYQSVPLSKIEDFGAHANAYYSLEIEHFKSSSDTKILDLLWNKYWVMTLSQSSLISNRAYTANQIQDLTAKLSKADNATRSRCGLGCLLPAAVLTEYMENKAGSGSQVITSSNVQQRQTQLAKVMRDVEKLEVENQYGMVGQIVKNALFNQSNNAVLDLPEV
ncbi:JAB1/Mov34/MPN/PAD-1 ubiquitin protease-domain-containing protein [Melampsora americana]|nr:JAB1/Mov34/MPN/PAD-1 ubiquitin protease-domain-containing protein [Melampsora americana]